MAGKAEFDAARDRLLATGAFESIGYKFEPIPGTQTNFGVFQIRSKSRSFSRIASRNFAIDEKAVPSYIESQGAPVRATVPGHKTRSRPHDSGSPGVCVRLRTSIGETRRHWGPYHRFPALFPPSVAEITFKGNTAIPTTKLQADRRRSGDWSGIYREPVPPGSRRQHKPAYEALGYLRGPVSEVRCRARPGRQRCGGHC